MAVTGLLAQYLAVKNQLSYYELQDTRWNDLATAMSKKLSEQENYQEKWDDASMSMYEGYTDTTQFKAGGTTFQDKSGSLQGTFRNLPRTQIATLYASAKVPKFNAELLEEYSDLDIEYSTMVSMYDTLIEELQAQADGLKDKVGTEAQDTHILGS